MNGMIVRAAIHTSSGDKLTSGHMSLSLNTKIMKIDEKPNPQNFPQTGKMCLSQGGQRRGLSFPSCGLSTTHKVRVAECWGLFSTIRTQDQWRINLRNKRASPILMVRI